MPQQRPLGCCSGPLVLSRRRIVARFEGREAIQQLQEGQAQVQAQVAEIMVQLQKLQPPPRQPPAAGGPAAPPPASAAQPPSVEVTLALMQQGLSTITDNIKKLDSKVEALDNKLDSKIQALDNKVVGLMVAVSALATLMWIKLFPLLRS